MTKSSSNIRKNEYLSDGPDATLCSIPNFPGAILAKNCEILHWIWAITLSSQLKLEG